MLAQPPFDQVTRQPQELAIIDDAGRYTYGQIAAMAAGLSAHFARQTNKPRLGLLLPSGAGFVASFYGALLAGKSVLPLNFLLGEREIAHCIRDSGIDTVVSIPQLDELGEILLKGPMVTGGYHNLPAETAAAFTSDGYFKTGDIGKLDAQGFLYITGRKKDLIIVARRKSFAARN